MKTILRQFEARDQASVSSLFRSGLTSYGEDGSDLKRTQTWFVDNKLKLGGDMNDIFQHYIVSEDKNFWVICLNNDEEEERVIGCVGAFTICHNEKELTELVRMSVSPDFGSLGIGSQLIKAVESWAISKGHSEVILSTLEVVDKARAFYVKNGYLLTNTYVVNATELNLSFNVVEYMKKIVL